ncbi:MAG: GNAT family N-acetyltransferase [Sphingomonadaceae bacterium]
MILRPASLSDAVNLAELGRSSFVAKFGHLYRAEDLSSFLEQVYAPQTVREEIAGPEYEFQLAEQDGALLGFCKMGYPGKYATYSDARDPVDLCQLYTAPDMTGRGIGSSLMQWALACAARSNRDAIQLTVWSENHDAQRFYQRFGFTKIADVDFYVGVHRDDEFLFEYRLPSGEGEGGQA